MILLYQFPRIWGLPNPSPFCLKLECWLRMTGLEYQVREVTDLRRTPRGKVPYIEADGETVSDSRHIIEFLSSRYEVGLDQGLTSLERAESHAFSIMLEEHYYWALVYDRWVGSNQARTLRGVFGHMPLALRPLVGMLVKRHMREELMGHGMGRHLPHQIYELANQDMHAVSEFLGDKPYLMGSQPSTVDATLYGLLCNVLHAPLESPLKDYIRRCGNLVALTERIDSVWFADFFGQAEANDIMVSGYSVR